MSKLLAVMIVGFGVAFGAGATAGMLWERHVAVIPLEPPATIPTPTPIAPPKAPDAPWMKDIVPALSDTQRAQIADIWKNAMKAGGRPREKRDELRAKLHQTVQNLMSEEQQQQYQALVYKTDAKIEDLNRVCHDQQEAERRHREEAARALLNDDQKKQYEAARTEYDAKVKELDQSWHKTFDAAVESTRQTLTAEQRERYDEIRKHFPAPPPNGFRQGGRWDHNGNNGPRRGPPGADHPEGGPPRNPAPPPNPNPN